jgi:hypothetical protein
MVNDELLSIVGLSRQLLLGLRAGIWLLEADKSKGVALESGLKLDVLDLSVGAEEVLKILLLPGVGEVLDIEVASLL